LGENRELFGKTGRLLQTSNKKHQHINSSKQKECTASLSFKKKIKNLHTLN